MLITLLSVKVYAQGKVYAYIKPELELHLKMDLQLWVRTGEHDLVDLSENAVGKDVLIHFY